MTKKKSESRPLPKNIRGGSPKIPTEKEVLEFKNRAIRRFLRDKNDIAYYKSFNVIIPIYGKIMLKLEKAYDGETGMVKFARLLNITREYRLSLTQAAKEDNPKMLFDATFNVVNWVIKNK